MGSWSLSPMKWRSNTIWGVGSISTDSLKGGLCSGVGWAVLLREVSGNDVSQKQAGLWYPVLAGNDFHSDDDFPLSDVFGIYPPFIEQSHGVMLSTGHHPWQWPSSEPTGELWVLANGLGGTLSRLVSGTRSVTHTHTLLRLCALDSVICRLLAVLSLWLQPEGLRFGEGRVGLAILESQQVGARCDLNLRFGAGLGCGWRCLRPWRENK